MKKVLGLDLGTTSIGWALVEQAENKEENSSIIRAGVRVNPLSSDEIGSFEKGKAITTNADRTSKRSARRNLQRYKQRRSGLIEIFKNEGWISDASVLSEEGKNTTYETYALRAKAVEKEISLSDLARVFLMINKKRGYKSCRRVAGDDEGHLIDGMSVARQIYESGQTPGQYCLKLLQTGKKTLPEFYQSDLIAELDRIWNYQLSFYPDTLTTDFREQISNKSKTAVTKIFLGRYGIYTADNKGKERRNQGFQWRVDALTQKLPEDILAYVIADLCGEISNSSGYLGTIGDRSKELYFQDKTVGQYLYERLASEKAYSTRNEVFYRQDYLNEFNRIWETQSQYHKEMTDSLKKQIRDLTIFYQRNLKSQKGLINFCEFEHKEVTVVVDGKKKIKTRGCRVAPRSSIIFQEFKLWQILNNVMVSGPGFDGYRSLEIDEMEVLAKELSYKSKMSKKDALTLLFGTSNGYEMNYKSLEGNHTLYRIFRKYLEIVDTSGHGEYDIDKMKADEIRKTIEEVFTAIDINTAILDFDSSLPKEEYEQQPLFKLWHLLYSYEGDKSNTGDESLVKKICQLCNMTPEYAKILTSISFTDDYSSLSHKAINKILPYLKCGNTYDVACTYAGYRHSKDSLTKEEIENKQLLDRLENIPKNALRNPVVEKILNQMVNVINSISAEYGKPDEIHIELARELKLNAKQRDKAAQDIAANTKENEQIKDILKNEFGIQSVRKTDIVRYKLYEELKPRGYKTLYSNQYVSREQLFSKAIDIEHIIPQALLFDDSYSNKTIEFKDVNIEKGKLTARDYVVNKYGDEGYEDYKLRVEDLYKSGAISNAKRNKLMMKQKDIPEDFINRDLTCSQYIAKIAKEILESYVKTVVTTIGAITKRLREDWQLVDVIKEINLPKYEMAGKTYFSEDPYGHRTIKIADWTKRNDHRHHAMDAITIAFTKPVHIQYLNNLAARSDKSSGIYGIMQNETIKTADGERIFIPPMPINELRSKCKEQLESILVSIKAKNKVVTSNVNVIKCKRGTKHSRVLTPRGPLHKEQVYGKRVRYETIFAPVGARMNADVIATVSTKIEREALAERLTLFGGDSRKAFTGKNSLEKNPIYLNAAHTKELTPKVKCTVLKTVYSIRKDIGPSLAIDKVMDSKVKKILQARVAAYGGNQTKAFANLEDDPIWLNKEKNIKLKRVTISENFDLCAIHDKLDKHGKQVLDSSGNPIPNDFVNLRNNHHIAIYKDADGNLQESVVSFFEALNRINSGLPIVDREYRKSEGWEFLFSMKTNEMFVFPNENQGFFPEEIDLMDEKNYQRISPNLYRVQKLASGDYYFRHHLETQLIDDNSLKGHTWKRISRVNVLRDCVKVRINHIGKIVAVGEYD